RVVLAWALRRQGRPEYDSAWKAVVALAPVYQTLTRPDLTRHFERIVPAERLLDLDRGGRSEAEVAAGLVGKAQRLVRTGDLPGALAELTRAAYLDPYASGVHTQLARVHRARGDRELALNELRMALWSREDPALRPELSWAEAEALDRKLTAIEKQRVVAPRKSRPETVTVTESELNSYLNLTMAEKLPKEVKDLEVHLLEHERLQANGLVDLDKVKEKVARSASPWNPLMLMGGFVPVQLQGRFVNRDGFGSII